MVIIYIVRLVREDVEVTPRNSVSLRLSEGAAWGFVLWITGVQALPKLRPVCYVPQRSGYNLRISFRN